MGKGGRVNRNKGNKIQTKIQIRIQIEIRIQIKIQMQNTHLEDEEGRLVEVGKGRQAKTGSETKGD